MDRQSTFFPIFLDLSDRRIVFVGGGRIATRRIKAIAPFAPQLVVVSPDVTDDIRALADAGEISWRKSTWSPDVAYALDNDDIVLACTDDAALNESIWEQCRAAGVLVNICSDHTKCDFYFPGIVRQGNVTVAVNASGRDHAQARELRERIQALLDESGDCGGEA